MAPKANDPGISLVERLEGWLTEGHRVPRIRGRVNRAALCRLVGLSRSSANSNVDLRALIDSLDGGDDSLSYPSNTRCPTQAVIEHELARLREENAQLKRQLKSVSWLLSSGRIIRS